MSVDLGAGDNALTLANGASYADGVERPDDHSGTGDDHVALGTAVNGASASRASDGS